MNKNLMVGFVVGLLAGVLVGFLVWGSSTPSMPAMSPAAGGPVGPAPQMPSGAEALQRIPLEEQAVRQDPKNAQAWVHLGNDYFDTRQPQKAIDAYAKALELQPGNADVLTDQGVMYRELRQFDKAIANFKQAQKVDPRHVQSLWNMGVVYSKDLNERQKAIDAWQRAIEIDPMSPQAAQFRQAVDELKRLPPSPVPAAAPAR